MPDTPQPVPDSPRGPQEALASRYGIVDPQKNRITWRIAIAIGAVLFLAIALWAAYNLSRTDVSWNDIGYSVHDAGSVTVDFNVTMEPGTSARCSIEALNANFAQVGLIDVEIPASEKLTTRHSVTVSTQELAVTGIVNTCVVI